MSLKVEQDFWGGEASRKLNMHQDAWFALKSGAPDLLVAMGSARKLATAALFKEKTNHLREHVAYVAAFLKLLSEGVFSVSFREDLFRRTANAFVGLYKAVVDGTKISSFCEQAMTLVDFLDDVAAHASGRSATRLYAA